MTIDIKKLGSYAPEAALKMEAGEELNRSLFQYKQLFYGLRQVAWNNRDKRRIFHEAQANGELKQFVIAPGVRGEDGQYTQAEIDWDGVNKYLWERFAQCFEQTFSIERVQGLSSLKDVHRAIEDLLAAALDNWGAVLLGNQIESNERTYGVGRGVTGLDFSHKGIRVKGNFKDGKRYVELEAECLPGLRIIAHNESIICGRHLSIHSAQAHQVARMMNWASLIAADWDKFLANPEAFLGADTASARRRNLQLIKERLLQINADAYAKRKEQDSKALATKRINEAVTAADTAAAVGTEFEFEEARYNANRVLSENQHKAEANPYEKLASPMKTYKVDPASLQSQPQPKPQIKRSVKELEQKRRQREREAQQWLAANADKIPDFEDLQEVPNAQLKSAD